MAFKYRWVAEYTDAKGKVRRKSFRTRREMRAFRTVQRVKEPPKKPKKRPPKKLAQQATKAAQIRVALVQGMAAIATELPELTMHGPRIYKAKDGAVTASFQITGLAEWDNVREIITIVEESIRVPPGFYMWARPVGDFDLAAEESPDGKPRIYEKFQGQQKVVIQPHLSTIKAPYMYVVTRQIVTSLLFTERVIERISFLFQWDPTGAKPRRY